MLALYFWWQETSANQNADTIISVVKDIICSKSSRPLGGQLDLDNN